MGWYRPGRYLTERTGLTKPLTADLRGWTRIKTGEHSRGRLCYMSLERLGLNQLYRKGIQWFMAIFVKANCASVAALPCPRKRAISWYNRRWRNTIKLLIFQ